jgi:quinol monooxygenase YgiN
VGSNHEEDAMIIRIFDTAMDPADIEKAKQLFRDQVRPVFGSFAGCVGIEMCIGVEEHSGDLVDVASISRWDGLDAIQAALETAEYQEAMTEIRRLFAQNPIVRHFEVTD